MKRMIIGVVLGVALLTGFSLEAVWGADLKVIQTHKTKDIVVTLLSESGQWTQGKNTFVLEFTSASTKQPVDVGELRKVKRRSAPVLSLGQGGALRVAFSLPQKNRGGWRADKAHGLDYSRPAREFRGSRASPDRRALG